MYLRNGFYFNDGIEGVKLVTLKRKAIDKVRASRDGHEYHEIWVARKSLELLNPSSDLKAIAVEGLSPTDQSKAAREEVEIADVVLYYGGKNFRSSNRVSILQFKYSVAKKNADFNFSDAKETIEKFAKSYKGHIERFNKSAAKKLDFQLITNRPISNDLNKTIQNIAKGKRNTSKLLVIENKLKAATGLKSTDLSNFASSCKLLSYMNLLSSSKNELENVIVSLSATSDNIASSRLGKLKELVREKAGTSGDGKNVIQRADLFAALTVRDINDLLPCPENLSSWGQTLEREQTTNIIKAISSTERAILIHAAGGV
ncbi:transcriptional regulator, partial [bacterium]|nr:transcriptional regulator [bacterium]